METLNLDIMKCLNWVRDFYSHMYPIFGLKKMPPLPEIRISYDKETTIRGMKSGNILIITKNPQEIMEYICAHESSHTLHEWSNPNL